MLHVILSKPGHTVPPWAVTSVARHPRRLCNRMPRQTQLPKASKCLDLMRIHVAQMWNGRLCSESRGLFPTPNPVPALGLESPALRRLARQGLILSYNVQESRVMGGKEYMKELYPRPGRKLVENFYWECKMGNSILICLKAKHPLSTAACGAWSTLISLCSSIKSFHWIDEQVMQKLLLESLRDSLVPNEICYMHIRIEYKTQQN